MDTPRNRKGEGGIVPSASLPSIQRLEWQITGITTDGGNAATSLPLSTKRYALHLYLGLSRCCRDTRGEGHYDYTEVDSGIWGTGRNSGRRAETCVLERDAIPVVLYLDSKKE